ncbi:MAG: hypothetical protein ACI8Q9_001576 [Planctomycetota bacterium]|jgi:hypothetical protein
MTLGLTTICFALLAGLWLGQTALFLLSYKASTRAEVAQSPPGDHL